MYQATDLKLKRSVAIKLLPAEFSSDAERLSRFRREAQLLASLNHPNIAHIYGLEESGHKRCIVMELVEGETLQSRLQKGPIPVDEALVIAKQICEALEAAHEKGVIHRDLKPGNVMLTGDGKVKVLDFGLAKAMEPDTSDANLSNSPTMMSGGSMPGVILGTAAYMSPEQARGRKVDKRSDIFAFGCVLYEMMTGKRVFDGEDVSEILARVMEREPDWSLLPPAVPLRIRELLRLCLEKNPKKRLRDAGDVLIQIEQAAKEPESVSAANTQAVPLWKRAIPVVVGLAIAAIAGGLAVWTLKPSTPPSTAVTRFPVTLPQGQQLTDTGRQVVAISPDGTQFVYVANSRLYSKPMRELNSIAIQGTEIAQGVLNPVFSPDGRFLAFWSGADQTYKRIAVSGGAAVTICAGGAPYGMSWGENDQIVFGLKNKGIMRVSANGGKPETIVAVKAGEIASDPQILPGGEAVLFTTRLENAFDNVGNPDWDKGSIVVQVLKTGQRKILVEGGHDGRYVPTGHIVYALNGTLLAIPFDLRRLEVRGGPVPLVEGIQSSLIGATGTSQFSFSQSGVLVYVPGAAPAGSQMDLGLQDLKGAVQVLNLPGGSYEYPRVSPDGKRLAFDTDDGKEAVVWIYDLSGGAAMRRLTFGGKNRYPLWSADGKRVAFQSDREGDIGIFWQAADGTGTAERLTKAEAGTSQAPESWSPNGETLLFSVKKESQVTLWMLSIKDKKIAPFDAVASSTDPTNAVFSPDGKWVAYGSFEGGRISIFVQPFPPTGAKYQLPSQGRAPHDPLWSRDGKELFSITAAGPNGLEAVSVTTQPIFSFGNPAHVPRAFAAGAPLLPRPFDMTPDGRILAPVPHGSQTQSGAPATQEIQVVLGWFEDLKQRVPVK